MAASKLILNEELPTDLRRELERDAFDMDITMNDTAVGILADHFGVTWTSSGRNFRPTPVRFKLRVPEELHLKLRVEAARKLLTIRGVALNLLSQYYETERIDPRRRPRKEAV